MNGLTDMKRTPTDKKAEEKKHERIGQEDYPYGLRVSLGHEEMAKLGIDSMPKVGDKVHLQSHAHVISTHEHSRDGQKPNRGVELELRHMAVGSKPQEGMVANPAADGAKNAMDNALNEMKGKPKKAAKSE